MEEVVEEDKDRGEDGDSNLVEVEVDFAEVEGLDDAEESWREGEFLSEFFFCFVEEE